MSSKTRQRVEQQYRASDYNPYEAKKNEDKNREQMKGLFYDRRVANRTEPASFGGFMRGRGGGFYRGRGRGGAGSNS